MYVPQWKTKELRILPSLIKRIAFLQGSSTQMAVAVLKEPGIPTLVIAHRVRLTNMLVILNAHISLGAWLFDQTAACFVSKGAAGSAGRPTRTTPTSWRSNENKRQTSFQALTRIQDDGSGGRYTSHVLPAVLVATLRHSLVITEHHFGYRHHRALDLSSS